MANSGVPTGPPRITLAKSLAVFTDSEEAHDWFDIFFKKSLPTVLSLKVLYFSQVLVFVFPYPHTHLHNVLGTLNFLNKIFY